MVGKSARLLAPAALVVVTVGVYLLVHSAFAHHPMTATSNTATIVNNRRGGSSSTTTRRVRRFYTVRAGDTLSAIAQRTGVSMADLTTLNPSLANSPNSLAPGQRLRLRH